ncbi:glycosyltransferase, partial [Candidatus Bathyarchaeota archaeon]|nr:glycosyltransferase [Candidatus Bathyarchaeota archaeon]
IDERVLARSAEAFQARRENMIAWIGKIRRFKCPHHAIMVLDRVRKMVPSCTLTIAGYPEDRAYLHYLKEIATRLGVSDAVIIKPRISEEEKGRILLKSKALLVTSPVEGFANVASEANACGTPVVATYGIPSEVVTNNVNGFRVAFGDVEAMAIACDKLLEDEETFERLSKQGVELARNRSWSRTAETFLSTINEAHEAAMMRGS